MEPPEVMPMSKAKLAAVSIACLCLYATAAGASDLGAWLQKFSAAYNKCVAGMHRAPQDETRAEESLCVAVAEREAGPRPPNPTPAR
jgi:hypothetical protein